MVKINDMTAKEIAEVFWKSRPGKDEQESIRNHFDRCDSEGHKPPEYTVEIVLESAGSMLDVGDDIEKLDLEIGWVDWQDNYVDNFESAKVMLLVICLAEKIHKFVGQSEFNIRDYIEEYERLYLT